MNLLILVRVSEPGSEVVCVQDGFSFRTEGGDTPLYCVYRADMPVFTSIEDIRSDVIALDSVVSY
jgi:hypothetical protein